MNSSKSLFYEENPSLISKKRLLIFIVAYNAENTIEKVLERIPAELTKLFVTEILIIDDSSKDETFTKSELVKRAGNISFPITVLYNPVNQGYGGNQKIGFHYAIEQGFDWVALVHGDGQYAPEYLPQLVQELAENKADAVFGSRMLEKRAALKGGMPLYKYVGNKILTAYQNMMLGSKLSEFHSGYRLYSTDALKKIPFQKNSNDFHFDTEIIIQLLFAEQRIAEIPIPTFYGDEICHVNGLGYAWNVVKTTFFAKVQPLHIFYEPKFDCRLNRIESDTCFSQEMYHDALLSENIKPGEKVLIVGKGGSLLIKKLQDKGNVVIIESSMEFLESEKDYSDYNRIFLLDDSGFALKPEEIINKIGDICRYSTEIKIIITAANVGFIITRLQLLFGRFGYTRQGVINLNAFHFFTLRSVKKMFIQHGFTVTEVTGLPIPYTGILKNMLLVKLLTRLHYLFIRLRKSLFSYQFVIFLHPPVSLEHLLRSAHDISQVKSEKIHSDMS